MPGYRARRVKRPAPAAKDVPKDVYKEASAPAEGGPPTSSSSAGAVSPGGFKARRMKR